MKASSLARRLLSSFVILFSAVNCAKLPEEFSADTEDGSPTIEAPIQLRTQCPYGVIEPSKPRKMKLSNCRSEAKYLQLANPLPEILFQADCAKMTLAIRTMDGKIDSFWNIMPDGSFATPVDLGRAQEMTFASDGTNRGPCVANTTLEVRGKVACTENRDRATIQLDVISFEFSPGSSRSTGSRGSSSERPLRPCQIPQGCTLSTRAQLKQCSS